MTDTSDTFEGEKPGADGPAAGNTRRRRDDTIAVALRYDQGSEFAPKTVAGGRGAIAEQILQVAFASGVKVRTDADLAEMLSAMDIESEIPIEAFAAVAEILAYVYRLNGHIPDFANPDASPQTTGNPDVPG